MNGTSTNGFCSKFVPASQTEEEELAREKAWWTKRCVEMGLSSGFRLPRSGENIKSYLEDAKDGEVASE